MALLASRERRKYGARFMLQLRARIGQLRFLRTLPAVQCGMVVTFQRAAKSDGEKKSGSCVSSVFMMSGVVY